MLSDDQEHKKDVNRLKLQFLACLLMELSLFNQVLDQFGVQSYRVNVAVRVLWGCYIGPALFLLKLSDVTNLSY